MKAVWFLLLTGIPMCIVGLSLIILHQSFPLGDGIGLTGAAICWIVILKHRPMDNIMIPQFWRKQK